MYERLSGASIIVMMITGYEELDDDEQADASTNISGVTVHSGQHVHNSLNNKQDGFKQGRSTAVWQSRFFFQPPTVKIYPNPGAIFNIYFS